MATDFWLVFIEGARGVWGATNRSTTCAGVGLRSMSMASRQWGGCRGTYLPCWGRVSSCDALIHTQSSESIHWMIHNEGRFKLTEKFYAKHVKVVMLSVSAASRVPDMHFFCHGSSPTYDTKVSTRLHVNIRSSSPKQLAMRKTRGSLPMSPTLSGSEPDPDRCYFSVRQDLQWMTTKGSRICKRVPCSSSFDNSSKRGIRAFGSRARNDR